MLAVQLTPHMQPPCRIPLCSWLLACSEMRCLGTAVGRAAPRQLAAPQLAAKRGASPQQLLPLRWGVRTRTAAGAANSQDDGSGGAVATTSAPELQADLPLPADLKEHFRPNVGVCVVNRQGLVFAATRVDDAAKTWQMPQGGIDRGESAAHAAMRVRGRRGACTLAPGKAGIPAACLMLLNITSVLQRHQQPQLFGGWGTRGHVAQRFASNSCWLAPL